MTNEAVGLASPRQLSLLQRPSIGKALKQQFADGKWHRLSNIAHKIARDEDQVTRA